MKDVEEIIQMHKPIIASIAKRLAKRVYFHYGIEYDDLYQEGCLAIIEHFKRNPNYTVEHWKAWIALVVRRRLEYIIRQTIQPNTTSLENDAVKIEEPLYIPEYPDFPIQKHITKLTSREQYILTQRPYCSWPEIGAHFNVSREAIRTHYNRIIKKLKELCNAD